MPRRNGPRDLVLLSAFAEGDRLVEEVQLTTEQYYDGDVELIDSAEYRAQKGIVLVRGRTYDLKGKLSQTFEVRYDEHGAMVNYRAVHADGTINEHRSTDS